MSALLLRAEPEPRPASFFSADCARESALSATTAANVQRSSAFMVDLCCRSPSRQLFLEFRIPSPFDLDV